MSFEHTESDGPPITAEAMPSAIAEPMSRTLRRAGRRGTRVLAVVSLLVGFGATGYAVVTWTRPGGPEPLAAATADAWSATGALSAELRTLPPRGSRTRARDLARTAAPAVSGAISDLAALDLPTSATPRRQRVLAALRADRAWIAAVRATLANPRSPRRSALARLAARAASATALAAEDTPAAKDTVGGTTHLLTATKR